MPLSEAEELELLSMERARAAARSQPPAASEEPEQTLGGSLQRAAGLGARHLGPVGAGMAMGAAMGAPTGIGMVPGALAGGGAMALVQMIDKLGGTDYINKAMDALGMPRAESGAEKIAAGGMDAMANMAGLGGLMATGAKATGGAAKAILQEGAEGMAAQPVTAAASAAGAGMAGEAAEQAGAGPNAQLAAEVAGSLVAPAASGAVQTVGRTATRLAGDMGHAVGASFGRQKSVERLAGDAVQNLVKGDQNEIALALQNATTHVPGATPTVAEAIAERNLKLPTRQVGGALVKLQDSISGHRGVTDVLPTKMKANEAAITKYLEQLKARTDLLREDAFRNSRSGTPGLQSTSTPPLIGVDPVPVMKVINYAMQDRAIAGHKLARQVLQSVARDLKQVPRNPQGRMDPEIMQGIRQSAGATMSRLLKETPTANQAVAAKALGRVHQAIDDAIEASGATGWKAYMKAHREGLKPVDQHIERLAEATKISKGIQATGPEAMVEETLPKIPTLLHRPTMLLNFALRLITKDATDPVTKELAKRLADPKGFAELMSRSAEMPARKRADKILLQAAMLSQLIANQEQAAPEQ